MELYGSRPGGDKHVLEHILGLGAVTENPTENTVEQTRVTVVELTQRAGVSREQPRHEPQIDIGGIAEICVVMTKIQCHRRYNSM